MAKTTVTYYMDIDETGAVRGAGRVENSLEDVDRQAKQTEGRFNSLSGVMGGAFVAALGLAFQQGVTNAIDKGTQFQSKLAELEAITGITGERLTQLGDRSLQLSTKYGTAAANIVEANKLVASQLAQKIDFNTEAGFQQLQAISEQAIVLQRAAGIQLQEAVATTTSVINQFNLTADESERVINTLAAGSKYGAAEVPAIGSALVNAGSAAASANQSIETTNAAIQVLAANGQVGERAGTALRAIFTRLKTESQALAEAGIRNVNVESNGLVATLKQLEPLLQDTTAAKKIFGEEALNQIQILIRNADAVGQMQEQVTGTQIAYQQAETNLSTYEGAMDRLWKTIDKRVIQTFMRNEGVLVQMANGTRIAIESLDELWEIMKNIAPAIAGATAAYAGYRGALLAYQGALALATLWERRAAVARLASMKAQSALNAVMSANPIGAIITVLGALVGILATNSEAWEGFKILIGGVWQFLKEVFFNLPQVAYNSFKLIEEIMRAPFTMLNTFAGNIFENLASNFWKLLSAMRKGITGDFAGAWQDIKSIGASVGGSFMDAAEQQMANIGSRVDALVASADFGPAIDKIATGGAQMGAAMAEMFTLTGSAGVQSGASQIASDAGQQLSGLSVDPDGNIVGGGGSGSAAGNKKDNTFGRASMGSIATVGGQGGAFGESLDTQQIAARRQAREQELAVMQKIAGMKAESAKKEQTLTQIALDGARQRSEGLSLTTRQWENVAARTGQAAARAIEYGETAKEILKGVIKGVINQVIALWVRNAVQTAGASGPLALAITPVLVAGAQKAASAVMDPLLSFGGGGLLSGPLHRDGGIRARVGGRADVELEGEEYVMNRESTRRGLDVIDAMNADPSLAASINSSFTSGRARTINAMPGSSRVNNMQMPDIGGQVAAAVKKGIEDADIRASIGLRHLDEEQGDERENELAIGNDV